MKTCLKSCLEDYRLLEIRQRLLPGQKEDEELESRQDKTTKHSINVGNHIRILKEKQTFQKGYDPKYSSEHSC
jgi:hypothetical protein